VHAVKEAATLPDKPAVGLGYAIATGVPGFACVIETHPTPANTGQNQSICADGFAAALSWRVDLSYSVALHDFVRTKTVQVSAALRTAVALAT
jgi:hypothetical protein